MQRTVAQPYQSHEKSEAWDHIRLPIRARIAQMIVVIIFLSDHVNYWILMYETFLQLKQPSIEFDSLKQACDARK